MSRFLRLLACSLFFSLSGCHVGLLDPIGEGEPSRALLLEPTEAVLHVPPAGGEPGLFPSTLRFGVLEQRDETRVARTEGLLWESSDPAIAVLEADGTVRALATGSVSVSVRVSDIPALVATASVYVKDGGQAHVVLE